MSDYDEVTILGIFDGLVLGTIFGNVDVISCFSLGSTDGNVLVTILRNVDGITLGIDVVTELSSLDGSFDGSNVS